MEESMSDTTCKVVVQLGSHIPGHGVNTPYAFVFRLINSASAYRYQALLQGNNECKNNAASHPC